MKPARALLLALLLAGCSQRTDLLPATDGGASCANAIQLGNQAPCAGALAAGLLRYSLCSCTALVLDHGLYTEGAPPGPQTGYTESSSVGTDDFLKVAGPLQIAGSLSVGGGIGAIFGRTSSVFGSLYSGGSLAASQFLSVGGDAFVEGDVLGRVDVANTLHVPMDAQIEPSVSAKQVAREPVQIDPPCNCEADAPFDLNALVMAHASINDNAAIGLDPDALASGSGPQQLTLPCGEYFLSAINVPDDVELELVVHGRAALFVAGDVTLGRGLRVTLDGPDQLDLVVMGDFSTATGIVGAMASAQVRLWLASTTVQMGSGASFSAAVYAPGAILFSDDDLSVHGALFVASLSVGGDLSLHFDADILNGGAICGASPPPPVQ